MIKQAHRVVVSLTDATRKVAILDERFNGDIQLLNEQTLLLRMNNNGQKKGVQLQQQSGSARLEPRYYRQLEFDAVGYEQEQHVRSEIGKLVNEMFLQKQHGCLMRFTPQRVVNMNLLTRIFVAEVDKVQMQQHIRLRKISLEYFDVRKFEMVNMLKEDSKKAHRKKILRNRHVFQTTRELFQWLITDFSLLQNHGVGDDYIDVSYSFIDSDKGKQKLHLSLFHIFDTDRRLDIESFFKTLPSGKCNNSSLLTSCMRESFDYKRPISSLLLFEIPLGKASGNWISKTLNVAGSAFINIDILHRKNCDAFGDVSKQQMVKKSAQQKGLEPNNSVIKAKVEASPSHSSRQSVPTSIKCESSTTMHSVISSFCKEDYNSLAYWYNRIDIKAQEVQLCMEHYYETMYKNKALKFCNQLKCMAEDPGAELEECVGDCPRLKIGVCVEQVEARDKYNEMLAQYHSLSKLVEKSCFSCTLKVYLSNKNYELSETEKALKQREIQNLHQNLLLYIKNAAPTVEQQLGEGDTKSYR